MENVLISGGSGFIGRSVTDMLLQHGYRVAWLSRSDVRYPNVRVFHWDPAQGVIEPRSLLWADAIVHLPGAPIAGGRWSEKRKKEIIRSRTGPARFLQKELARHDHHIHKIVSVSAIGYYGASGALPVEEPAVPGHGFLSSSVIEWEKALEGFKTATTEHSVLRVGIVLDKNSGALPKLLQTAPIRIIGVLGGGKQMYSWIHREDVCSMILFALKNPGSHIYNCVAPQPVAQKVLAQQAASIMRGPFLLLPVPAMGLRMVYGEMADTILSSQNISSKKVQEAGFTFRFPDIHYALSDLLKH